MDYMEEEDDILFDAKMENIVFEQTQPECDDSKLGKDRVLHESVTRYKKIIPNSNLAIKNLENQLNVIKKELELAQTRTRDDGISQIELTAEIALLKTQLQQEIAKKKEVQEELESQETTSILKIGTLEGKLQDYKNWTDELKGRLDTEKKKSAELYGKLEEYQQIKINIGIELNDTTEAYEALRKENKDLKCNLKESNSELLQLQHKFNEIDLNYQIFDKRRSHLIKELQHLLSKERENSIQLKDRIDSFEATQKRIMNENDWNARDFNMILQIENKKICANELAGRLKKLLEINEILEGKVSYLEENVYLLTNDLEKSKVLLELYSHKNVEKPTNNLGRTIHEALRVLNSQVSVESLLQFFIDENLKLKEILQSKCLLSEIISPVTNCDPLCTAV